MRNLWRAFMAALCVAVCFSMMGCTGAKKNKAEFTVLIRMMPAQQRFFEEEFVAKFNKEHNCKISVATFTDQWDIERFLKLDKGKKNPEIGLVKTPLPGNLFTKDTCNRSPRRLTARK